MTNETVIDPSAAEQEVVLQLVRDERAQQEARKADARWEFTCADDGMADLEKLAVLGEEFGEVARALIEQQATTALRAELVQVAAVAVAWAESLLQQEEATRT
jgi:NTP pyrophosphatase (non-canonical NTP hydrolase)